MAGYNINNLPMNPIDLIKKHEGCRLTAYQDTRGIWTIGWGYARGVKEGMVWTQEQADAKLEEVVNECIKQIEGKPWYQNSNENRRAVLVDMCYNLGYDGLNAFQQFLYLMTTQQYAAAADDGLKTKWAHQVGRRAVEDMDIVRVG